MKVLIIGFGSIGKRHFEILSSFEGIESVDLVTKQNIDNINTFKKLDDVKNMATYGYFIIASETSKHHSQLKYICSKVRNKKIVVEKPLYDKNHDFFECNNTVLTAYNLRFHPVIDKLKELIKSEKVYYVNVICGQYLPSWRPRQDYRQSYSADINQGGGVLRDLSHELDYIVWLFGSINSINSINTRISDLDINSDDIFTAIAVTEKKLIVNLTVDYISKVPLRRLLIHTKNKTIEADVIKNSIVITDKMSNRDVIEIDAEDRNYTYSKMHQSIITDNFNVVCSFDEGKRIVDLIDNIEFKEL